LFQNIVLRITLCRLEVDWVDNGKLERRKVMVSIFLFLAPLVTGALLNLYMFYNQFRGGAPLPWFFRYATGLGHSHNVIVLFIDWTALATDLLVFFGAGVFCFLTYAWIRMK